MYHYRRIQHRYYRPDNVPVATPLTVTVSPNCLLLTVPVSPAKFKPFINFCINIGDILLILAISVLLFAISPAFFRDTLLVGIDITSILSMAVLLVLTLSFTLFQLIFCSRVARYSHRIILHIPIFILKACYKTRSTVNRYRFCFTLLLIVIPKKSC